MPTTTRPIDWTAQLVDQLDFHWNGQLRPRLEGMTDDEYHFSPAAYERTWDVRPRGTGTAPMQGGEGEYIGMVVATMGLAVAAGVYFAMQMRRRLSDLEDAAGALARGDFDQRAPTASGDG